MSGSLGTPILGVIECRLYSYIGCKVVSRESCERNDVGRFVTVQKQGERLDEHVGWVEPSETHPPNRGVAGCRFDAFGVGWMGFASLYPSYVFGLFLNPSLGRLIWHMSVS